MTMFLVFVDWKKNTRDAEQMVDFVAGDLRYPGSVGELKGPQRSSPGWSHDQKVMGWFWVKWWRR